MLLGITGGLATGKSLVTRLLRERGAVTFSADEAARAVLSPGGAALTAIARQFGPEFLTPHGGLDRDRMGAFIFSDPDARLRLNAILHPLIRRLLRAQMEAARWDLPHGAVIAVEIPLLYESHLESWFERVLVVTAPLETQVARLMLRNGLDEAEARRRIAVQMPLAEKAARADFVIANHGSLPDLEAAVDAVWRGIC